MRLKILSALLLTALVGSGQTPASSEVPKRTIFDSTSQSTKTAPSAAAPGKLSTLGGADNGRGASSRALDSLSSSTEDLNLIRDSNVRRLNGDGCAPETSARLNDLRARLQASGVGAAAQGNDRAGSQTADLALASDWFKRTGDGSSSAAAKAKEKEDLLDSVLPGKRTAETPAQDVANLKAELERLLTTCAAPKR